MKIQSTDAVNVGFPSSKDTSNVSKEINVSKDTKDTKEDINYTRLTNAEKNELSVSDKVVIQAIEKANNAISGANRRFEFSIHEKTKEIMVKVIDSTTNEVIREIPPEKILDLVAKMWEMAGIIVDERR